VDDFGRGEEGVAYASAFRREEQDARDERDAGHDRAVRPEQAEYAGVRPGAGLRRRALFHE
jgi:hypothetical protein